MTLGDLQQLAAKSFAEGFVVDSLFHAWPLLSPVYRTSDLPLPQVESSDSTMLFILSSLSQLHALLPSGSPVYCQVFPFEVRQNMKAGILSASPFISAETHLVLFHRAWSQLT